MRRDQMESKYYEDDTLKDHPNGDKIKEVIKIVIQDLFSGLDEGAIKRKINKLLN